MSANKTLTIVLTGRPPVRIAPDDWPVIASAFDEVWDGEYKSQATRLTSRLVKVRQHRDGRAIIYAVYRHHTAWAGERSLEVKRGVVLPPAPSPEQLCETIQEVCRSVGGGDEESWDEMAERCIADLPPVPVA